MLDTSQLGLFVRKTGHSEVEVSVKNLAKTTTVCQTTVSYGNVEEKSLLDLGDSKGA